MHFPFRAQLSETDLDAIHAQVSQKQSILAIVTEGLLHRGRTEKAKHWRHQGRSIWRRCKLQLLSANDSEVSLTPA